MSTPIHVTDGSFEQQVINAETPILVDFWAEWCGPCKMIAPVLEEIAMEYEGKLQIGKLDVDNNPDTAMAYGVMSIPTLLLFKSGQLVAMAGDAVGKAEIEVTRQSSGDLVQEIEIDIGGLAADTHFEVFVDGARVGAIRTDAHGAGELEHYGKIRSAASQASD